MDRPEDQLDRAHAESVLIGVITQGSPDHKLALAQVYATLAVEQQIRMLRVALTQPEAPRRHVRWRGVPGSVQ